MKLFYNNFCVMGKCVIAFRWYLRSRSAPDLNSVISGQSIRQQKDIMVFKNRERYFIKNL